MKYRSLLAMLAALALLGAACGDDDDDTAADDTTEESADDSTDSGDDVSEESGDEGDSEGSGDGICAFSDSANNLGSAFEGIGDPNADPDELEAQFEDGLAFFEEAADEAPDEL